MSVHCVRPLVADLVFELYDRPLHPEFFDILAVRRIERSDYDVTIHITRSGHFITWRTANLAICEVADVEQPFAQERRLFHRRLRGEHTGTVQCGRSVTYQMSFQVETLPPEIYLHVHDEILADGSKGGLLHNFQPNHRLAVAPLGYVAAETRAGCLFVSTFHTFPEEHAVVKSQTLIEKRPPGNS